MENISKQRLADDLATLGIERSDKVLVRADLGKIGRMSPKPKQMLIEALLEVVGEEGAVIGLLFTKTELRFQRNRANPFTKEELPVTGSLAKGFLTYPGAFRSSHPTNSFGAVGEFREALDKHNADSHCFAPIRNLIDEGGKMLLVGCADSSPGFSTVHLAQFELGYSTKNLLSLVMGRYYTSADGEEPRWFKKRDIPGCSMGFHKFYPLYEDRGILSKGSVGNAESLLVNAADAYSVEKEALKNNPKFALCDRDDCVSCRMLVTYKFPDVVRFVSAKLRGGKA